MGNGNVNSRYINMKQKWTENINFLVILSPCANSLTTDLADVPLYPMLSMLQAPSYLVDIFKLDQCDKLSKESKKWF